MTAPAGIGRTRRVASILLKALCLAIFASALAGVAGWLPGGLSSAMQIVAVVVLVIHALELVFAFKYVRLYRGPLFVSILLAMMFGFLHWKPLADQRARVLAAGLAENA
ncbi:MAG: hypothetical protein ACHQK9_04370 [Reyranellales bacterium]